MSKYFLPIFSVLLFLSLGLSSCQNEEAAPNPIPSDSAAPTPVSSEDTPEENLAKNQKNADENARKVAEETAMEAQAEKVAETPKASKPTAKFSFDEKEYEFGMTEEGSVVKHNFIFKNTGKIPLLITNATSTCGCTIPEWPKEPIPPGEQGMISATFDTKGKLGSQKKEITITANTSPKTTKVALVGFVGTMKKKGEDIDTEQKVGEKQPPN